MRRKTPRCVNTVVSSSSEPSLKWNVRREVTRSPRTVSMRSPLATTCPCSVVSERKPCSVPSGCRTWTGSAIAQGQMVWTSQTNRGSASQHRSVLAARRIRGVGTSFVDGQMCCNVALQDCEEQDADDCEDHAACWIRVALE